MTLHEAADELFDIRDLCDGFADMSETRKGEAMLKQLSMAARVVIEPFEHIYPRSLINASRLWANSPIADCLAECKRIAETIREG